MVILVDSATYIDLMRDLKDVHPHGDEHAEPIGISSSPQYGLSLIHI